MYILKLHHREFLPTDDREKGCRHEEGIQNTHNGSNSYLSICLDHETDDDVEHRRNACNNDGQCPSHLEDKLESTWQESTERNIYRTTGQMYTKLMMETKP